MTSRHTSRAALTTVVLAVLALFLSGLVSPAEAATSTGTVKGVVTLKGKPVKNAKVQLYTHLRSDFDDSSFAYDRVKTVSTDSKGRYAFSGVKAGTWKGGPKYRYAVLVTDRTGKGAKTLRYLDVKKGRTTTGKVGLQPSVVITGSITRSDGGSPADLTVSLSSNETRYDDTPENEEFLPGSTTAVRPDGTFTIKGQAAGSFQLVVRGEEYLYQCYDFETNTLEECMNRSGTDVFLTAGERRVLTPVVATKVAPAVSKLSGTVTDPSGHPLKDIQVSFRQGGVDEIGAPALTRSSGRYNYQGRLPEGTYQVRYSDPERIWGLGDGPIESVTQITVTPGQTVAGVNARLRSISTSKVATKVGRGTAKVAFTITRKATGSGPGGTLTLSYQGISKTVTVKKGAATITLTGLRAGYRELVAEYSGTSTTTGFSKVVKVTVK
ncbi:MAG: hypothetical protein ABWX74_03790 [Aeromicrobium sp.]